MDKINFWEDGNIHEEIAVPIYFIENDDGTIIIDEESIIKEFNEKLEKVVKNPKKYLEI